MHGGQCFPGLPAIPRAEQVASLLVLDTPGGNEHDVRILRIDDNVIEHIVIAASQMSKSRPTVTTIQRLKQASSAGSKKYVVEVTRIVSETAGVSAVRSKNFPLFGPQTFGRQSSEENSKQHKTPNATKWSSYRKNHRLEFPHTRNNA